MATMISARTTSSRSAADGNSGVVTLETVVNAVKVVTEVCVVAMIEKRVRVVAHTAGEAVTVVVMVTTLRVDVG
jgi:hypothetical protein